MKNSLIKEMYVLRYQEDGVFNDGSSFNKKGVFYREVAGLQTYRDALNIIKKTLRNKKIKKFFIDKYTIIKDNDVLYRYEQLGKAQYIGEYLTKDKVRKIIVKTFHNAKSITWPIVSIDMEDKNIKAFTRLLSDGFIYPVFDGEKIFNKNLNQLYPNPYSAQLRSGSMSESKDSKSKLVVVEMMLNDKSR